MSRKQKAEDDKQRKERPIKRLADEICARTHFARDAGSRLYHFANGVYQPHAEKVIKTEVKALCLAWHVEWSSRLASEVAEFIRVDAPDLWERPPVDIMNLLNGLLRIGDRQLLPHSPGHLSPVQLPVNYDPSATCPAIDAFIAQVFPSDAHRLAWEIIGWLMVPDTAIQKAVLFRGDGANGKSTYLTLVTNVIGSGNISGVSLHKLEGDRFSVARLIGKLANICPDLPSDHLAGTSVFKALTGGDALLAERKFGESFEFRPFCRLVFSANHLPRSADASPAFFRRWLVIPFDRTFSPDEQIPRDVLDSRLSSPVELSGMLNKCLDALARLKQQGGFSEPESVRQACQEFQATTDPLAVWLDRMTVDDPNAYIVKDLLRTAYAAECERRGRPPLTDTAFGLAIQKHRPHVAKRQKSVNGKSKWCYAGIGWKADSSQGSQG